MGREDLPESIIDEVCRAYGWMCLWLVEDPSRRAAATAIVKGQEDNVLAGELLKEWAMPRLKALTRDDDIFNLTIGSGCIEQETEGLDLDLIPWRLVASDVRKPLKPV